MSSPKAVHNSSLALQKYMLLQEQHQELCSHLDQIRAQFTTGSGSIHSTPSTSPTRSYNSSLQSSPRRHSRGSQRRHHSRSSARGSGWEDARGSELSTILDEETLYELSAEEQRLFDVNESIKRALTELLNCNSVRGDRSFRMWVQTRLMETEKELRLGRRRRSTNSVE
ncbi:Fc.00g031350.m01.CDS01 [Cosmosporella sp. VM-42]